MRQEREESGLTKPETLRAVVRYEPGTRNLKPETHNWKPETRNPGTRITKPRSLQQGMRQERDEESELSEAFRWLSSTLFTKGRGTRSDVSPPPPPPPPL